MCRWRGSIPGSDARDSFPPMVNSPFVSTRIRNTIALGLRSSFSCVMFTKKSRLACWHTAVLGVQVRDTALPGGSTDQLFRGRPGRE